MGILDKYNEQSWKLAYYPPTGNTSISGRRGEAEIRPDGPDAKLASSFDKTSLDLENSSPLGGPINIAYTTKVGSETVSKTTTQPYTPKNTYIDNLQSDELIERARDPFR